MTWATSGGVSESRQPSPWRVCSSEGVHARVGFVLFEAEIRARLIRDANSVALDFMTKRETAEPQGPQRPIRVKTFQKLFHAQTHFSQNILIKKIKHQNNLKKIKHKILSKYKTQHNFIKLPQLQFKLNYLDIIT